MLMAIEVEIKRRSSGAVRLSTRMGDLYSVYAWDYEVDDSANARHAFRRFRRELLARGVMDEKLVWDVARTHSGGWVFVARMNPTGEEV